MATQFQKEYLHYLHGKDTYAYSPNEKAFFSCEYVNSQIIYVPLDIRSIPKKVLEHFNFSEVRCPF